MKEEIEKIEGEITKKRIAQRSLQNKIRNLECDIKFITGQFIPYRSELQKEQDELSKKKYDRVQKIKTVSSENGGKTDLQSRCKFIQCDGKASEIISSRKLWGLAPLP